MSGQSSATRWCPEPTTLGVGDSAQDAGQCFAEREDVRAVFVVEEDGRLVGVITRKTLVREVVAAGKHPSEVQLREIAEPPLFTLDVRCRSRTASISWRSATSSACRWSRRADGSSACCRARSCSAGSRRTSRRSSIRIRGSVLL